MRRRKIRAAMQLTTIREMGSSSAVDRLSSRQLTSRALPGPVRSCMISEQGLDSPRPAWSTYHPDLLTLRHSARLRGRLPGPSTTGWSFLVFLSVPSVPRRRFAGRLPSGGQSTRSNARSARLGTTIPSMLRRLRFQRNSAGVMQGEHIAKQKRRKALLSKRGGVRAQPLRNKSGQTVRTKDKKKSIWR